MNRSNKQFTKKEAQKLHALKRLKERYGIEQNSKFLGEIIGKIKNGEATLLEKQSNRVFVCKLEINNLDYFVVYDNNRESVVTFLTAEMIYIMQQRKSEENLKDSFVFKFKESLDGL